MAEAEGVDGTVLRRSGKQTAVWFGFAAPQGRSANHGACRGLNLRNSRGLACAVATGVHFP
jgi:hypothetical protein